MEEKENILGTEKVGKLIRKFSIPCIISMLVNSLYNIVDQIFIGWNVGYLGNGATNVVFPLTMICLAFALMFGDGTSAFFSLKLGEQKKDEAAKGVGNGIVLSAIMSALICIITLAFLPQILTLFGCTESLRPYALDYGYIIAIGLPFMMIGVTLNSIIRADGNPKYSMLSMTFGAILNIVLDYIFMFKFNMGVKGAAIATAISQFANMTLNVVYIRKFKSVKIFKDVFKLKKSVCKNIVLLGISSFITQMSIVFVIICENNMLVKCGANSEYGTDIPITVLGIVMKISQILNSIVIGIAVGAQPIFGYNYGAQKFDRVKKALRIVLTTSVIVSTIAFILFQLIPDKLIGIFGSGDAKYIDFACIAFRIYLMLTICNGIQIPSGIFFQAIGKSLKSTILSISRQVLFLIPAMIILGNIFGIRGVLFSGPVADALAFIISLVLLILEVRALVKKSVKNETVEENVKEKDVLPNKTIITISREYGSGGRYVGKIVADKLGIKLYDKELVKVVSEQTGLSEEFIEENEQKRNVLDALNNGLYYNLTNADELFVKEQNLIKELANKESCVIVGRCADFILKDMPGVTNVFIYSDEENKIKRAVEQYGLTEKEAKKKIKNIDAKRSNHYNYYTGAKWGESSNYDICINSDKFGVEKSAEIICNIVK